MNKSSLFWVASLTDVDSIVARRIVVGRRFAWRTKKCKNNSQYIDAVKCRQPKKRHARKTDLHIDKQLGHTNKQTSRQTDRQRQIDTPHIHTDIHTRHT
jgi:hypothetical protein